MARFQLQGAHVINGNKYKSGSVIVDTQGNAVAGDIIIGPMTSSMVTAGMIPLDGAATTLKNGSRVASVVPPCTIDGANSIA